MASDAGLRTEAWAGQRRQAADPGHGARAWNHGGQTWPHGLEPERPHPGRQGVRGRGLGALRLPFPTRPPAHPSLLTVLAQRTPRPSRTRGQGPPRPAGPLGCSEYLWSEPTRVLLVLTARPSPRSTGPRAWGRTIVHCTRVCLLPTQHGGGLLTGPWETFPPTRFPWPFFAPALPTFRGQTLLGLRPLSVTFVCWRVT